MGNPLAFGLSEHSSLASRSAFLRAVSEARPLGYPLKASAMPAARSGPGATGAMPMGASDRALLLVDENNHDR